ncbi:MAG: histidine phosphatase family protein [Actinomycetota bacterium]
MGTVRFLTHPDVILDPKVAVPQWGLSERGCSRMARAASGSWVSRLSAIWSSDERKAIEAGGILAEAAGLTLEVLRELAEIDRSSTGVLPGDEHLDNTALFYSQPDVSARGWETARAAQQRILQAV